MAGAVRWLPWHANIVHRGGTRPPGKLYAAVGCGDSRFEGFVSDVEVSPYEAVSGRRKVRDVLEYVRGGTLSGYTSSPEGALSLMR
ncbi:hypothetical protein PSPO01_15630 [Paraphaeosphaeria sporulosa]